MFKWFNRLVIAFVSIYLPVALVSAQTIVTTPGTIDYIFARIYNIMGIVAPIIMTLALLYFFWGLANYILGAGDEEKKETGRNIMIYGIIALFVMAGVWGLVEVLNNTFLGGTNTGAAPVPELPRPNF